RTNLARRGSPDLAVVVFDSWRDDPVAGLATAVEREVAALGAPVESRPSGGSLGDILAGWSDTVSGRILVVLDQFEEYFHYHGDESGEGSFVFEFADAVTRPELRVN